MIKLIGVLIIIIGFLLKVDVLAVVLTAAIITGLVSGMSLYEVITLIGNEFVKNRQMSIFLLTLPVIGVLEKFGLKERASLFMSKFKSASAGKILIIY